MYLNLGYLLLIRLFAIGGQVMALSYMNFYLGIHFPINPVILIITLLSIFTAFSWLIYRGSKKITDHVFVTQLMIDIIALSLLIYFTGGSINPFISLFILPIIFAAASLKPAYTFIITLVAIGSYTSLMFFHVSLDDVHIHTGSTQIHLWGMWFGFILTASLVAYFVARISYTVREQDRALAEAREEALRADRILALGTLAAGTAHELGTPLSTMAVITGELLKDYPDDEELAGELELLKKQIQRCKTILSRMSSDAGQSQADAGNKIKVDSYIQKIINNWQQTRSDIDIDIEFKPSAETPEIIVDRTLTSAIINVLNNAADASSKKIHIVCSWNNANMNIEVIDDGHGIEKQHQPLLGKSIFSTKPSDQGLGIGLFLAETTLNRMGGKISLSNYKDGGAHAEINIPLSLLLAL
jgi:two-component system, sensor histidine kinase RegB